MIDEQPQLLLRSNRLNSTEKLQLLIELSQLCQSTVTNETCHIGCGWLMLPVDDGKPPLITDTKSYNELLHGGHTDESNVLLDPTYLASQTNGLSNMINRLKRARMKFSLESREDDMDVLYDNLPVQSLVVPINLIRTLTVFRNELASQFHKRHQIVNPSTTPIDSIFLSTFNHVLHQPDLILTLDRLYSVRKKRHLNSSSTLQQQREEFIRTYELFIYPLLEYRLLPSYNFHDLTILKEREKLINVMIQRQMPTRRRKNVIQQDIVSILLDSTLTDQWTPFTVEELCFSLQQTMPNSSSIISI
jgi:hypothetical protein